jgi:hypothetical protein
VVGAGNPKWCVLQGGCGAHQGRRRVRNIAALRLTLVGVMVQFASK